MFTIEPSLALVLYSELFIAVLSLFLLTKEISTLKEVLSNRITISLLTMLIGVCIMSVFRIVGIWSENTIIRVYLSALCGLIATLAFINWGSLLMNISNRQRYSLFGVILLGMISFIISRLTQVVWLETIGITTILLTLVVFMIIIMRFVFTHSPYVRSRHKLFILSISFIFFSLLEGIAVMQIGIENYVAASLFFFSETPFRIGISLGILMPQKLTQFLLKFIH